MSRKRYARPNSRLVRFLAVARSTSDLYRRVEIVRFRPAARRLFGGNAIRFEKSNGRRIRLSARPVADDERAARSRSRVFSPASRSPLALPRASRGGRRGRPRGRPAITVSQPTDRPPRNRPRRSPFRDRSAKSAKVLVARANRKEASSYPRYTGNSRDTRDVLPRGSVHFPALPHFARAIDRQDPRISGSRERIACESANVISRSGIVSCLRYVLPAERAYPLFLCL